MDYRGLIVDKPIAQSWRDRWESAKAWAQIPDRQFTAKAKDGKAEILIYEQIGESFWDGSGVGAKKFAETLRGLGDVNTIDVRINSPGGEVSEGDAIYSQLVQHKATINVYIDGLAASAASFVAMAGDTIAIAENAKIMIHNAWGLAVGNANDMRKLADTLDVFDGTIRGIYAKRTGQTDAKLRAWMDDETWFDAASAIDAGFADTMLANKAPSALAQDFTALMQMRLALVRAAL